MVKYIRLISVVGLLSLGLLFGLSAWSKPTILSKDDCANIAMAAGLMQEYINQGEKHPLVAMTKGAPEQLPDALKQHLLLMEKFQLKFKGAEPQQAAESYFEFCLAAKGDLEKMEKVIKEGIAKPVGEPI